MSANISHLAYSSGKFEDVITTAGLKPDFDIAKTYVEELRRAVYMGPPVNIALFSDEHDHEITISKELQEKLDEHQGKMQRAQEWNNSDADLIFQYSKNFEDFKKELRPYINWHCEIIKDVKGLLHNEAYELELGIDVAQRTLREQ